MVKIKKKFFHLEGQFFGKLEQHFSFRMGIKKNIWDTERTKKNRIKYTPRIIEMQGIWVETITEMEISLRKSRILGESYSCRKNKRAKIV